MTDPDATRNEHSAILLELSQDWRRKTGHVARVGEAPQPHEVSEEERRVEMASASREARHIVAASGLKANAELHGLAAEVVTRDRPVDARTLADSLAQPANQVSGRQKMAYAAMMLGGMGR